MKEHAVSIATANRLVGIVSEAPMVATNSAAEKTGAILLNSGLIHRVGPNRLYVNLARRLAESGIPTLRFDLSAIGDSPQRGDTAPFAISSVEETLAAVEYMRARFGLRRLLVGGICTGAVVSFRAAQQCEHIDGLIMINAQGLISTPSDQLKGAVAERADSRYYTATAMRSRRSWARLLSGQADYGAIARAVGRKVRDALEREVPTTLSPEQQEVVGGFDKLLAEGRRILLLYSDTDPGLDELAVIYGGGAVERLKRAPGVRYTEVAGADHMFTALDRQEQFVRTVCEWARGA